MSKRHDTPLPILCHLTGQRDFDSAINALIVFDEEKKSTMSELFRGIAQQKRRTKIEPHNSWEQTPDRLSVVVWALLKDFQATNKATSDELYKHKTRAVRVTKEILNGTFADAGVWTE